MDDKDMGKIIENLKGKIEPTEDQLSKVKEIADKYQGKSEEELVFEIIKLNKMFSENMNKEEYEDKMSKLEKIRPLLDESQKEKLDKLLAILNKGE